MNPNYIRNLLKSLQTKSNKQNVKSIGYSINNMLQYIRPYSEFYEFRSWYVKRIYISMQKSFGANIFDTLQTITGAGMFSNIYFPVILDNNFNSILMLTNSIVIDESDKVLCSRNLIKNVMAIICSQMQNNSNNFIQYHRIPFFSSIIHDFLFILSIMFIMLSKFEIEQLTLEKSVYTIKYQNTVDSNELNILLDYENFFNIVNKYHIIKNCTEFVYTNAVRFIEGPNMDGRMWGSGATKETLRRKNILNKVCNYTVQPRPPRQSHKSNNSCFIPNSLIIINSESELEVEEARVGEAGVAEAEAGVEEVGVEEVGEVEDLGEVEAEIVPESEPETEIDYIENLGTTILKNSIEMYESMRIEIPFGFPNSNLDNSDDSTEKRKSPDYNDNMVETLLSIKSIKIG